MGVRWPTASSPSARGRLVLFLVCSVGLFSLLLLSLSSNGGFFPPSFYRPSRRPITYEFPPSTGVKGLPPPGLPLLGAQLASTSESIRLRHLERLELLNVQLEGFENVGFVPAENARQVERLRRCLEEGRWGGRCSVQGEGAKVVLVGYKYFSACALTDDLDPDDTLQCHSAGETIWMRSMLESFERNDVFYLNAQPDHIGQFYRWFGDIITHVWAEDGELVSCLSDPSCVASNENPTGIPPWKLFATTWWGHPPQTVLTDHGLWTVPEEQVRPDGTWSWNPLGSEWTLSPYQMPENLTYLGYNIIVCDSIPVLPADARQDSILILAKKTSYFSKPEAWPLSFYSAVANATGFNLISSAHSEAGSEAGLPEGVVPHERMTREAYEEFVGEMRLLLGVGNPATSPSPFNALCQGVPVVLPFSGSTPTPPGWDLFDPHFTQHGPASLLGEPYVYSLARDAPVEEAIATIRRAASTSIDRYVPEDMTVPSVDARLVGYLNVDWERMAILRQGGVEMGPVSVSRAMVDECRRLKFCASAV